MRLGLVSCSLMKAPIACAAKDLYISRTFRARRQLVESTCDRWLIVSSRHGITDPDKILAPYDEWMRNWRKSERLEFQRRMLAELSWQLAEVTEVEIHAGSHYYNPDLEAGLITLGVKVDIPTRGLSNLQTFSYLKELLMATRRGRPVSE